jgi:hypothetical protein
MNSLPEIIKYKDDIIINVKKNESPLISANKNSLDILYTGYNNS